MSNRARIAAAAAITLTAVMACPTMPAFADGHQGSEGKGHHGHLIHTDDLMPVLASQTGTKGAIRGINGGGLPWVIGEGELDVRADGRVHMEVEGLVIDPTETANPAVAGINPVAAFKVIVSCVTASGVVNVSTATTPATRTGNAELDTMVSLPSDCMSPIGFVTSPGGAWFARSAG